MIESDKRNSADKAYKQTHIPHCGNCIIRLTA